MMNFAQLAFSYRQIKLKDKLQKYEIYKDYLNKVLDILPPREYTKKLIVIIRNKLNLNCCLQ